MKVKKLSTSSVEGSGVNLELFPGNLTSLLLIEFKVLVTNLLLLSLLDYLVFTGLLIDLNSLEGEKAAGVGAGLGLDEFLAHGAFDCVEVFDVVKGTHSNLMNDHFSIGFAVRR